MFFLFMVLSALALVQPQPQTQSPRQSQAPPQVPDYLHEAQTCSRVDLRPRLEDVGFEAIRNRGGREDASAFAFSEQLGLAIGEPISARWLEHWLADHGVTGLKKTQVSVRALLAGRLRACLESAVPSEDIESSRLARLRLLSGSLVLPESWRELFASGEFARATFTSYACADSKRTAAKAHASLTLTETRGTDAIDRALRAGRLPIVIGSGVAISGRRLSAETGACEYLVRNYEGPVCTTGPCEDGSTWMPRTRFVNAKIWSLEP